MSPKVAFAARILFAAGAFLLLFYFVPVSQIAGVLAGVELRWCALGFGFQLLMRFVACIRLRVVAESQGIEVDRQTLFRILLAAHYYSMLLLGPLTGGGVTWLKLVQRGASRSAAVATVVLNRGFLLIFGTGAGLVAWSLDRPEPGSQVSVLAAMAGAFAIGLPFVRLPLAASREAGPDAPRASWPSRIARRLGEFQRVPPADRWAVLLASLAQESVAGGVLWCFARAVGLELDYLSAIWIQAALRVALMLPFTIAGLGLREATLIGMGAALGVPATQAAAWSLVLTAGSFAVAALGGWVESGAVVPDPDRETET